MIDYQTYYQAKAGSADINLNTAVAGSLVNCTLTYHVGELGIADGGTLKLLFRISSDVAEVQFDDQDQPNYVSLSSNQSQLNLAGYARSNGFKGRLHQRPWTNGFFVFLKHADLLPGDWIKINFSNWRMQTFLEQSFKIKLLVDPFATGKYIELPHQLNIDITPDLPTNLVAVAPTTVNADQPFTTLVKLEDKWGNPCTNQAGEFKISNYQDFGLAQESVKFNHGKADITCLLSTGTNYLQANYQNLTALSNPITVLESGAPHQFWADLHWQSEETCGSKSLEECISFARNYALLDVTCPQGNGFEIDAAQWHHINQLAKKFTKAGQFIVFPGYEWSGQSGKGGDRNVLFLNNNANIYRSSHALLNDFFDTTTDSSTASDLFANLKTEQALVLAHVGGRYANLDFHDPDLEKTVEVHSDWGTFEWFVFDALDRGYKVGIIANSDNHSGRPGASAPGLDIFDSYGGLTCILANKLTKPDIFQALHNRHVYGTTGARIYINASCNYELKGKPHQAVIGDELPKGAVAKTITINCKGTTQIEKIDIFNKSNFIYTYHKPISDSSHWLKITWTGTKLQGRDREYFWDGQISFSDNQLLNLEPINFYHHSALSQTKNQFRFNGFTTGNTQGCLVELAKNSGALKMKINNQQFDLQLNQITHQPTQLQLKPQPAHIEIFKTTDTSSPEEIDLTYQVDPHDLTDHNALFIKVTQQDGHMLWTSPFYFDA